LRGSDPLFQQPHVDVIVYRGLNGVVQSETKFGGSMDRFSRSRTVGSDSGQNQDDSSRK
jgi:hypothetical protein